MLARLLCACLALTLLPVSAQAADPAYGTARYYYPHCKASLDDNNSKELFSQGECIGMLQAVSFFSEQLSKEYKFCSPSGVIGSKLATVLIAYMDANQNKMESPMLELAIGAFRAEWPCR